MSEERAVELRRWRPRWQLALVGLLLLCALIIALLWVQRREIATGFIERELQRRGVAARYRVTEIGFRTQRLENLVIGDPARPDLVADWVEVEVSLGFRAPSVELIRARGVRLRGRVVDGQLRLGEIDKLLPPPSGAPFSLPDLTVDVADTALILDTPAGRVVTAIEGRGKLADGFRGRSLVLARALDLGGCRVTQMRAALALAVTDRRPALDGPVGAAEASCGAQMALAQPRLDLDVTLAPALNSWIGRTDLTASAARMGDNALRRLGGRVSFSGDGALTRGTAELAASGRIGDFSAARLAVDGRYALAPTSGEISFLGGLQGRDVGAGAATLSPVAAALASADGTPLGPIGERLSAAVRAAGRAFDADASIRLASLRGGGGLRIDRLSAASRSGARVAMGGAQGLTYYWPSGRSRLDGGLTISGGGFPDARLRLRQGAPGGPIEGVGQVAPLASGGARLQLATIRFKAGAGGATRVETMASMDGPISDGRVAGLVLPVRGRFGDGGFAFGERCTEVRFRALTLSSLTLGPTRLPLCPTGRALVWSDSGPLRGGASIAQPRLNGRLGGTPMALAADRFRFDLPGQSFSGAGLNVRLGQTGSVHRLDLARLDGRLQGSGAAGRFSGAAGQIARVPLLISEGSGDWRFAGGDLTLGGSVRLADDNPARRFFPLVSNDFRLAMRNNQISAGGLLRDPESGTPVTQARIEHSLASGSGRAVLDVPGITFGETFQPEALTRLTTGVVALVNGTVQGQGRIDWSPAGVSSSGEFSTAGMNLAAPFGPVQGLTTTIRFNDLLGLQTAPGQTATVDLIQAGIDVFDGQFRYQLLPGQRVRIEAARWPFAGGELLLDETILDFSQQSVKRLVFRVVGVDAAAFVERMQFGNIAATGTFDGVIPMEFDISGGRIAGGQLIARTGTIEGGYGGVISYVGELTDKDLGAYGKLAFDALKSLRYSKLTIALDGPLTGEFLMNIELDGVAVNRPTAGGFVGRAINQVAQIPFEFNIRVQGPFRALLATMRSFDDPSLLIQPVLPENLRDLPTEIVVQPKESETVQ